MRSFLRSIQGLIVLFFTIIFLFLTIVITFYYQDKENALSVQSANLQLIGKLKSDYIDKWFLEREADGSFIFNDSSFFKQSLLRYLDNSSQKDSSLIAAYLSPIYENHRYLNLFILDASGNTLLSLNSEASAGVEEDSVQAAALKNEIVFSTIYPEEDKQFNLDIYVPVRRDNNHVATVVIKIDPSVSLFPMISSWYEMNSTGESLIVTSSGDSILNVSPLKNSGIYTLKLSSSEYPELPASKAINGITGVVEGTDYRGVKVLADIRRLNNSRWFLITKMDLEEVYRPVTQDFFYYIIILCLIVFLGGISLLYYHTRLNFNHLKKINESESRLRVILEHSTNMFYSHSTDHKLTYVSPQSFSFLGYKPKELMISWKDIVTDNPLNATGFELTEKAIKTGKVQPPYELELRKKDGSFVWVEVHEAPVVKNGKTTAIVGSLTEITQRKKAEKALYESEEIFRHFMENSPIYVFFKDENIRALRLSNNYEQMLGRPLNEIIGKTMDELFPSELAKSMIEDDKKILREKKLVIVNEELNGRYYTTLKFPIIIDGQARYLAGYTIDITERSLAEKALRESEEKYRHLFENMLDGVYKSTPEGKFVEINPSLVKMLGYSSKEELLSIDIKTQLYFQPEERQSAMLDELSKEMAVFRLKKKDGSELWVEDHGQYTRDEKGDVVYYEGILRDISERRVAEERIKTLSQALEQSPVSVLITDPKGNIEYVNPRFTHLSSYSSEEVIGKNPRLLKSGELPPEEYKNLWSTINSGKEWHGELLNRKKNGQLYWVEAIISPIVNRAGEIIHFIALEEDVTEKKKMIEELIISRDKAEEINRLKSYFFASMSHELRTPFVGIIGYAEILLQILKDNDSREMVETILASSRRLMDTLNKILTVTKLEFEPYTPVFEKVNINRVLEECYKTFAPVAAQKKIEFRLNTLPQELLIESDERLLRDIFNNLVSNAVKYTLDGKVEVCTSVFRKENEDWLKISVSDTGIGIPKEKQDQVWLAFRQGSEGLNRIFEGTGLGLTITRKYIELLGAEINLHSEPEKGSTFIIGIPVNRKH